MANLHHTRFAASFVAMRWGAQAFFHSLGCRPLVHDDGEVLAPFVCARHGAPTQLLALDWALAAPRVRLALKAVQARLQALMAPAGHPQRYCVS